MYRIITGLLLAISLPLWAAEPAAAPATIQVECCGKLRCGMVAAGGETTGTTVTFNNLSWEIKVADEAMKKFVNEHHKQEVKLNGTLRRVVGIARKDRWIVEVSQITERDKSVAEGAKITIKGTPKKDAVPDQPVPITVIAADGMSLPLTTPQNSEIAKQVDSLMTKPVLLTGHVKPVPGNLIPKPWTIEVDKITPNESAQNNSHSPKK